MSKSRRKNNQSKSTMIMKKPGWSKKNTTAVKKEDSAAKTGSSSGQNLTLLQRKKGRSSIEKDGISKLSLTMWICLALVGVAAAGVVYDATHNNYVVNALVHLFDPSAAERYDPLPLNDASPKFQAPESKLVWIPGGWFWMGSDDPDHPDSNPIHKVYVDGYWIGKYEVTNDEWAEFIRDTDYKTIAEKKPTESQLHKFTPDEVKKSIKDQDPFSIVFTPPKGPVAFHNHLAWWKMVEGADWRHPEGPKSSIKDKGKYPVVHVSYLDVMEYLKWKNKQWKSSKSYKKGWEYRLPTEAEWEFAARGKKNQTKFCWGDELKPGDTWLTNIWQGQFPHRNSKADGYERAAPVGHYKANGYGLYDMAGNVWEWCQDYYMDSYYKHCKEEHPNGQKNPTGPEVSFDPREPGLPKRVQRGGSFLCHVSYCERYLTYARGKGEINSAANHTGFRIVLGPALSSE